MNKLFEPIEFEWFPINWCIKIDIFLLVKCLHSTMLFVILPFGCNHDDTFYNFYVIKPGHFVQYDQGYFVMFNNFSANMTFHKPKNNTKNWKFVLEEKPIFLHGVCLPCFPISLKKVPRRRLRPQKFVRRRNLSTDT